MAMENLTHDLHTYMFSIHEEHLWSSVSCLLFPPITFSSGQWVLLCSSPTVFEIKHKSGGIPQIT